MTNGPSRFSASSVKLRLAVGLLLLAGAALHLQAVDYTLVDGNAIAQIDVNSSAGMHLWGVADPRGSHPILNQLNQQWFWYRVGNNPEAPINTISATPVVLTPNNRTLSATYANSQFSVRIDYVLSGGTVNSGLSDIGETITIHNTSGTTLPFHFFQYSDFDIGGPGGDSVQLGRNIRGLFNEADQSEPNIGLTETVTTPGANHGEAAFYNSTLLKLNDANADNLNDQVGPVGPGNVTWALQWDRDIPADGTLLISKDKYLDISNIPEPTSAALLLMGIGICALRKRGRA